MTFRVDRPEPGYYRRRMVRMGPWIPARIWIEPGDRDDDGRLMSDERIRCEVGGIERDPMEQWSYLAGHPIPEAEYRYMMARAAHAREHDPEHPAAEPGKAIDLGKLRPLF